MKTMYYANFSANNGTHYNKPICGANKKRLIKDIREIAEAERFSGNECSWIVYTKSGNGYISVASGGKTSGGRRWRDNTCEYI